MRNFTLQFAVSKNNGVVEKIGRPAVVSTSNSTATDKPSVEKSKA